MLVARYYRNLYILNVSGVASQGAQDTLCCAVRTANTVYRVVCTTPECVIVATAHHFVSVVDGELVAPMSCLCCLHHWGSP